MSRVEVRGADAAGAGAGAVGVAGRSGRRGWRGHAARRTDQGDHERCEEREDHRRVLGERRLHRAAAACGFLWQSEHSWEGRR